MRVLRILLEKEFRQIFRDPAILRMIFIMPTIQLLIFPLAADYEVKHVNLCVIDYDHSSYSNQFVNKIKASGYFSLVDYTDSHEIAMDYVENDKVDLILQIPNSFEKQLVREDKTTISLEINAINGAKAIIGSSYLNYITADFNDEIRQEWNLWPRFNPMPIIQIEPLYWYNPLLNYYFFMVPGILVILITMVGSLLTALNIVKEKEVGTIEQINVTPVKKYQFILGKLIPFWILGLIILSIGLTISWLVYGIVPLGHLSTIYIFSATFLIAVLGLGFFLSTIAKTQQQAMLFSFFLMMLFILLGGLYTSIESMPYWAQIITWFNPVSYFIEVMRMVVLKGSSLSDIKFHIFIVLIFAVFFNLVAIWNYKKRS